VISITSCKVQILYASAIVDSSLQLSISANALGTASSFRLPSEQNIFLPAPLLQLSWLRCQSKSLLLAYELGCAVRFAALVLKLSLTNEKKGIACLSSGVSLELRSTGRILGRNWDKSLRVFPLCFSQSRLLRISIPRTLEQKCIETGLR
jgi:hypothetical protein